MKVERSNNGLVNDLLLPLLWYFCRELCHPEMAHLNRRRPHTMFIFLSLQSLGNVPYHQSAGQIELILSGNEKDGYTIKRAEAIEQHVVTPFSQAGGQLTASARYSPSNDIHHSVETTFHHRKSLELKEDLTNNFWSRKAWNWRTLIIKYE